MPTVWKLIKLQDDIVDFCFFLSFLSWSNNTHLSSIPLWEVQSEAHLIQDNWDLRTWTYTFSSPEL